MHPSEEQSGSSLYPSYRPYQRRAISSKILILSRYPLLVSPARIVTSLVPCLLSSTVAPSPCSLSLFRFLRDLDLRSRSGRDRHPCHQIESPAPGKLCSTRDSRLRPFHNSTRANNPLSPVSSVGERRREGTAAQPFASAFAFAFALRSVLSAAVAAEGATSLTLEIICRTSSSSLMAYTRRSKSAKRGAPTSTPLVLLRSRPHQLALSLARAARAAAKDADGLIGGRRP